MFNKSHLDTLVYYIKKTILSLIYLDKP